jgi:hypothetical protein
MGVDVLTHFAHGAHPAALGEIGLLFVFLLAAGVTAMAGVGFTLWAAYHVVRLVVVLLARLLLLPMRGRRFRRAAPAQAPVRWLACPDPVCRAINPEQAHFCRQCGRMVRRAAELAA